MIIAKGKVMFSQVSVILFTGGGGCLGPGPGGGWGVWQGVVSRLRPGGRPGPGWGGLIPACTEADTPQQTATAVGGTHPTGTHSCFQYFNKCLSWLYQSFFIFRARSHQAKAKIPITCEWALIHKIRFIRQRLCGAVFMRTMSPKCFGFNFNSIS